MALEQFADTCFDGSTPVAEPRWREPTVVLHDIPNGNIDSALVTITDTYASNPTIEVDRHSGAGSSWRHFMFGVSGMEGKRPLFKMNRATKLSPANIASGWKPCSTTDFDTWNFPETFSLVGGTGGTIDWQFDAPLTAATTYLSSNPTGRLAECADLATEFLTTYSSVAAPTTSANASGIYTTTTTETNHNGVQVGGNAQYSFKLDWGGATTDGHPKRKMVLYYGIHAAGESQAWWPFYYLVHWMLDNATQDAIDFRANWDVYIYFALNPNGLTGGNHRFTFRSGQDMNRDWPLTGFSNLIETDTLRGVVETDTNTDADLLVSCHGDVFDTGTLNFGVNPDDNLAPRAPALQEIIDQCEILYSTTAHVQTAGTTNTDTYWGFAKLGCKAAFDFEHPACGPDNTLTHWSNAAEWTMRAIVETDSQGLFNDVGSAQAVSTGTSTATAQSSAPGTTEGVGSSTGSSTATAQSTGAGTTEAVASAAGAATVSGSSTTEVVTSSAGNSVGLSSVIAFSTGAGAAPSKSDEGSGLYFIYHDRIAEAASITATTVSGSTSTANLGLNRKSLILRSVETSDQIITATWNTFQTINGVGMAFTNLNVGSSFRVRTYLTTGASTPAYDSGFIDVDFAYDPPVGFSTIGYNSFAYGGGNYLSKFFDDQQCQKLDVTLRSPDNPDGAIEISRLVAGKAINLFRGASYGATVSYDDSTDNDETDGGDLINTSGSVRKRVSFTIRYAPASDRVKLANLSRGVGKRVPVFVSLNENKVGEERKHFQVFGILENDGLSRDTFDKDTISIEAVEQ